MIEDHRHGPAEPHLTLPAHFADWLFDARTQQPPLEGSALISGVFDESQLNRKFARSGRAIRACGRVKVVSGDSPRRRPLLHSPVVVALRLVAEKSQRVGPAETLRDSRPQVLFREWSGVAHVPNTSSPTGRDVLQTYSFALSWGARIRTRTSWAKANRAAITPLPRAMRDAGL